MRQYSTKISLVKNSRGIYGLDTTMGCSSGMSATDGGCYGDCYAAKSAKLYGYDFSTTVIREFESLRHKRNIVNEISKIKMPFVRMGCSGDPSENWEHSLNVCQAIKGCNKEIVIITKHWTSLTDGQLQLISGLNICVNTSVSALDNPEMMAKNVKEYNRLKSFCKSVLRIVSCDFNLTNPVGYMLSKVQDNLFKNDHTIDTVFRPSKSNQFVLDGIVKAKPGVFNGHKALMSKYNRKSYTGKCSTCKEMCGVNINNRSLPIPITKQPQLF